MKIITKIINGKLGYQSLESDDGTAQRIFINLIKAEEGESFKPLLCREGEYCGRDYIIYMRAYYLTI